MKPGDGAQNQLAVIATPSSHTDKFAEVDVLPFPTCAFLARVTQ